MRRPRRSPPLAALLIAFCAGVLVDWALRTYGPPLPAGMRSDTGSRESRRKPNTTAGVPPAPAASIGPDYRAVATSGSGPLRVPLDGYDVDKMKGGFAEKRGDRPHEAVDMLAPRNTPIHAVESGTIAKLFTSKQGGLTIYQYDPGGKLCYYYAHLERYADGLHEGQPVSRGDVIGYVGTSGNAPANTPHLHFAVFELDADRKWWHGRAIDPYLVFTQRGTS